MTYSRGSAAARGLALSSSEASHGEQGDDNGSKTGKHDKMTVSVEVGNVSAWTCHEVCPFICFPLSLRSGLLEPV